MLTLARPNPTLKRDCAKARSPLASRYTFHQDIGVLMSKNKYDKNAEQKLLVAIYRDYVKNQGDQPSQLDVYQFNGLKNDLYKDIPEVLLEPIDTNKRPNVDSRYFMNLKNDKYLEDKHNSGLCVFILTKQGFYEAKRLIHPYRSFFFKHWKYIVPICITFIGVILTIIRLTQCP